MIDFIVGTLAEFGLIHADYKHRKKVRSKERKDGVKRTAEKYLLQPSLLLIFLVIFLAVASSFVFFNHQKATVIPKKAKKEFSEISKTLNNWKNHYGSFPLELNEIIEGKPLRKGWLNDVWNTPYKYNIEENGDSFTLISAGPDRTFNTQDDIKSE